MIRRDERGDWLIIPQIEHARIAGELARAWSHEPASSLPACAALLWGVEHHDDGWREWDKAPRVNPVSGVPRSFMEMRMRDSTAIWTQSIGTCSSKPLAGIAVSRHFCHLAKQVQASGKADEEDRESLERFLREQADVGADLAHKARSEPVAGPIADLDAMSDLGFRTVRFFDMLSLWLCCAERHQPETHVAPDGEAIKLVPQSPTQIAIEPYPLQVATLRLETKARRLAARTFLTDADFQAELRSAPIERLAWTMLRRSS